MRALRLTVVGALALGLVACGGAKLGGGKEGAAAALFAASGPTKSNGALLDLAGQGHGEFGLDVAVDCQHGGKAVLKGFHVETDVSAGTTVKQSFRLEYQGCGVTTFDNPETAAVERDRVVIDGNMTVSQSVITNTTGGSVTQTFKGKLSFGGAFSDFLDADVTQSVDWAKLGTSGGSVSVTLNGTLATSTATHTYAQETLSFTAGVMVAAEEEK